jgi:hypothetical protein
MAGQSHRSVRREIRSAERGLRELQREVGDTVSWYELDRTVSTADDIYDEGPGADGGLRFRAPRPVPAVWIRYQPPTRIATDQGEYTLSSISLRVSVDGMRRSGLDAPLDPDRHFDDRFGYNGFLYRVESYVPRGWMLGTYIMVDVSGRQLKPDELQTDVYPFWEVGSTAHTQGESLDWPDVTPDFRDQQPGI